MACDQVTKTLQQYFADWEANAFGFGYGTGEMYVIACILEFMENLKDGRSYDYSNLYHHHGPVSTWFLINALARGPCPTIEYGTSPRFGWLTKGGEELRKFMLNYSCDQLYEFTCIGDNDIVCYPYACNCGPNRVCPNPFWGKGSDL